MDVRPITRRVIALGLDGYETTLGERLMAAGELPVLSRLRSRSARFLLDHGAAQRTGLAWEHVSTGRSPEAAKRWSAVSFEPATYEVWQEGTSCPPFLASLAIPAVVFDPPYFDLERATSTSGVVGWGAHDPGVEPTVRPASLAPEWASRFGSYPASEWLYGIVWPSPARARQMGEALVQATDRRAEAACWLLGTRLPDWRLAIVVSGELHSAIEGLWHGIDANHPLHRLPSAPVAADGLRAVYGAVDRLVGRLTATFHDATFVIFATGGMGANHSDVASMVLLPELLHRYAFHRPLLREQKVWTSAADGIPMLADSADWTVAVNSCFAGATWLRACRSSHGLVPAPLRPLLRRALNAYRRRSTDGGPPRLSIDWMPASRYQCHWPAMRFFALPSFYDGRIRINLAGRERDGRVAVREYDRVCDEIEALVGACRDARTGEPVVSHFERCGGGDPVKLGPSECDLVVVWRAATLGFDHPEHGRIGPVPYRRVGGHTGPFGMAYVSGEGINAGDGGVRSSFDVVPTLVELLGLTLPPGLSGRSLLAPRC